jgi:hypothetical protein
MEEKKKEFDENKGLLKEEQKLLKEETVYERAYQYFLSKLLNDKNNTINKNAFPIKLERSTNIVW